MRHATGRRFSGGQWLRGGFVAAAVGVAFTIGAPATARAQLITCPGAGTLQELVDYGPAGCRIGDKIFHFFSSTITSTGFATTLTNADISYVVINPDIYTHGFELRGAWVAPPGGTLDHNLAYRVTWIPSIHRITDVHLLQTGDEVLGGPDPTGFVAIDEDVCVGALFTGGCVANGGFIRNLSTLYTENPGLYGPSNHEDAERWYPGVRVLDIDKDILVFGGTGGAFFSNVHQVVTQIPEPSTVILLGAGLGLMGVVARSRRRQA